MIATAQVRNVDNPSERHIVLTAKNFGQTPAKNVIWVSGEHVREWPLVSTLPDAGAAVRRSVEPLAPGRETITTLLISALSEWEEATLRAGQAGIYAWGTITYEDSFGYERETKFIMVCEGEGFRRNGLMHATEKGNSYT